MEWRTYHLTILLERRTENHTSVDTPIKDYKLLY